MDELRVLVAEKKPEIIGITESWCYDEILDSELEITGYKLFREDRSFDKGWL